MKTTGIFIALLALTLAGCNKPTAENTPSDTAPDTSAPAPPKPATVAEERPAATPPPAAATPEIAPPGRYYLRRKTSVETADGLTGYAPGTPLQQTAPGRYRTADGHDLDLPATDVTNDLAEARRLTGQSVAVQAAARAAAAPRTAPMATTAATATPAPAYIAPVQTGPGGLQSSTSLSGGSHSKTADGIVWEKSPDGKWWVPVKWTKNGSVIGLPLPRAAK